MPPGELRSSKSRWPVYEDSRTHESFAQMGDLVPGTWMGGMHWSALGDPCASDRTIMEWALAGGPSVIQVRAQDITPSPPILPAGVGEIGQGAGRGWR